jgi:ACS family hexuronate transporter-like MFS transporter
LVLVLRHIRLGRQIFSLQFLTCSPKRAIGSVVGIGGFAGGIGGVLVTKMGGWIFDSYAHKGISESFAKFSEMGNSSFVNQITSMDLASKYGDKVNLNVMALSKVPVEVADKLKNTLILVCLRNC